MQTVKLERRKTGGRFHIYLPQNGRSTKTKLENDHPDSRSSIGLPLILVKLRTVTSVVPRMPGLLKLPYIYGYYSNVPQRFWPNTKPSSASKSTPAPYRDQGFLRLRQQVGATSQHQCLPVCRGLPGALPVLNERAVEFATLAALAINCEIRRALHLRPQKLLLPRPAQGYQISQFDKPIAEHGWIDCHA